MFTAWEEALLEYGVLISLVCPNFGLSDVAYEIAVAMVAVDDDAEDAGAGAVTGFRGGGVVRGIGRCERHLSER